MFPLSKAAVYSVSPTMAQCSRIAFRMGSSLIRKSHFFFWKWNNYKPENVIKPKVVWLGYIWLGKLAKIEPKWPKKVKSSKKKYERSPVMLSN